MSARARSDAGFTLVEALVSLFVFGLIASGAVAPLTQALRSQEQSSIAHEELRQLQTARALLFADLAQYVARPVREAEGARRPQFIGGDADVALSFVRVLGEPGEDGAPRTIPALIEYRIVDGDLIRSTRTLLDSREVVEPVDRVILRDAGEARFEFYDGEAWRNAWVAGSPGALPPRAVALVFQSRRYGEMRIEALVGGGR